MGEVGKRRMRPRLEELFTFEQVTFARAVDVFIGADRHGDTAQMACIGNLHRPVSKREQPVAADTVRMQNAFKDGALGKARGI